MKKIIIFVLAVIVFSLPIFAEDDLEQRIEALENDVDNLKTDEKEMTVTMIVPENELDDYKSEEGEVTLTVITTYEESLDGRIKSLEEELDTYKREESERAESFIALQEEQWGQSWGLDISGGIYSGYSTGTVSLAAPKIGNELTLGLRGTFAGTFVNQYVIQDGLVVDALSAWNLQAVPYANWSSPVMFNFIRVYGGMDLPIGSLHSFTKGENKYGKNMTIHFQSYGGLEVYSSEHSSFFLEAGGGGGPILSDEESNLYINQSSLYGGFMMRVGSRFYL